MLEENVKINSNMTTQSDYEWNSSWMLEISLEEPDDFLKVKETLTRIGVASKNEEKKLWQSCHILHKQGRYYICHFKELFMLDGKPSTLSSDEIARRNAIASLLHDWGLCTIVDRNKIANNVSSLKSIKIVPYREKSEWSLEAKYKIGVVKK
jgi:hypothetical protein